MILFDFGLEIFCMYKKDVQLVRYYSVTVTFWENATGMDIFTRVSISRGDTDNIDLCICGIIASCMFSIVTVHASFLLRNISLQTFCRCLNDCLSSHYFIKVLFKWYFA